MPCKSFHLTTVVVHHKELLMIFKAHKIVRGASAERLYRLSEAYACGRILVMLLHVVRTICEGNLSSTARMSLFREYNNALQALSAD